MNTTQIPSTTNSSPESDGNGAASPQRCYAELAERYQLQSELYAQLSMRVGGLERSLSTQNGLLRQTSEALSSCLALLGNSVTRQEWEVLSRRLNELSSLLPGIADMLGGSSREAK